jgi:hypothetical protein
MFLNVNFCRKDKSKLCVENINNVHRLDRWEFRKFIDVLCSIENKTLSELFKELDNNLFFTIEKGDDVWHTRIWKTKSKNAYNYCLKHISYGE